MIVLLEARKLGLFGRAHWMRNILAGLTVGVVALPLGMAFAIASGAKPEQGLYTAIIASLVTSLFGGTLMQISGPTGAFIVILSGITAHYGIAGLQMATLMAGVILLVMGITRIGVVIKYISAPVIVGFTSGIAVIIWVGQWKDFFGLHPVTAQGAFLHKLVALLEAFPDLNLATTLLGVFTLVILIVSPRITSRVPSPLIAMIAATVVQNHYQFHGVATIGSVFGGIPQALPHFSLNLPGFADATRLIGPAFTIALLGAIESLLTAVVADSMAGTRHDSNQELIGQGLANIASPLFGGIAATGAVARTATNIRNGANGPLSGIVHALTLVAIILLLAPLAASIPLTALAAILFVVSWNMSEAHRFVYLLRTAPKPDVAVLLITFSLTVFSDLVVAVNIGVILSSLLFMKRMGETISIQQQDAESLQSELGDDAFSLNPDTVVFTVEGPVFFGVAERLESTLRTVQLNTRTLVLRMQHVPFIDATGIQTLRDLIHTCQRRNIRLVLCETRPLVLEKLRRSGLLEQLGDSNTPQSLLELAGCLMLT